MQRVEAELTACGIQIAKLFLDARLRTRGPKDELPAHSQCGQQMRKQRTEQRPGKRHDCLYLHVCGMCDLCVICMVRVHVV